MRDKRTGMQATRVKTGGAGLFLLMAMSGMGCAQPGVMQEPGPLRERANLCLQRALRYPENPVVRAQAVEAAVEVLGDEAALRIRESMRDEHAGVRFAACMALGELRDTAARNALQRLVNDPDPNVRIGAYFALERLGVADYRRPWADLLLQHKSEAVRRNAALALGRLEDKSVIPLLRKAAGGDKDDGVRIQAAEAMALLGDADSIEYFLFHAYGGQGYIQPFALLTLGQVRDERAVETLQKLLETSPYLEGQLAAARGLGMHGYADGFALALASLDWNKPRPNLPDDPPFDQIMRVQCMSAAALGAIGRPEALDPLRRKMDTAEDPRIQLAAATAILKILNKTAGGSAPGNP